MVFLVIRRWQRILPLQCLSRRHLCNLPLQQRRNRRYHAKIQHFAYGARNSALMVLKFITRPTTLLYFPIQYDSFNLLRDSHTSLWSLSEQTIFDINLMGDDTLFDNLSDDCGFFMCSSSSMDGSHGLPWSSLTVCEPSSNNFDAAVNAVTKSGENGIKQRFQQNQTLDLLTNCDWKLAV